MSHLKPKGSPQSPTPGDLVPRDTREFNLPCNLFSDPNVWVPLTWPEGTYGLPMPKTGCPEQRGFSWHTGTRYQDTENTYTPNNHWSSPYDLAGAVDRSFMEQKFCLKTQSQTTDFSLSWPKGEYCIFKKGNKCPTGG